MKNIYKRKSMGLAMYRTQQAVNLVLATKIVIFFIKATQTKKPIHFIVVFLFFTCDLLHQVHGNKNKKEQTYVGFVGISSTCMSPKASQHSQNGHLHFISLSLSLSLLVFLRPLWRVETSQWLEVEPFYIFLKYELFIRLQKVRFF